MANEIIEAEIVSKDALTEFGTSLGIARAKDVAARLAAIVKYADLSVDIRGQKYLKVEAWLTLAGMCGMTARTREIGAIREEGVDDVLGYRAYVEVIRVSTGDVIGGAYGRCDFSETLNTRQGPKIRWNREEPHACESMAQTRATSKAIAQVLRWIPTLAGFQGTPMEEMPPKEAEPQPRQPKGEKWTPNPEAEMASDSEEWGKPAAGEPEGPARENAPMALKSTPQGPLADSRGGKASPTSAAGEPAWLDEPLPKIQSRPNWQGNTWRWLASAKPGSNRHSWVNGVLDNPQAPRPLRLRCEYVMMRMEGKA